MVDHGAGDVGGFEHGRLCLVELMGPGIDERCVGPHRVHDRGLDAVSTHVLVTGRQFREQRLVHPQDGVFGCAVVAQPGAARVRRH